MFPDVLSQFNVARTVKNDGVEDLSDKLNFFYSTLLLMTASMIVTLRTYFLDPLACHVPNVYGKNAKDFGQLQYVTTYCWTEGTYAVSPKDFVIDNDKYDGGLSKYAGKKIFYYQWIPFLLSIQCIAFYIPRILWINLSSGHMGTSLTHIVSTARDATSADDDKYFNVIEHICRMLEEILVKVNYSHKKKCGITKCFLLFVPRRLHGSWLALFYFGIKSLYLINSFSQLCLMHVFLKAASSAGNYTNSSASFGVELMKDLIHGRNWENTMMFPRVGSCAFFMKSASSGNWMYSQCSLPINMFNEKIFIFLWFWLIFISGVTVFSIILWLARLLYSSCSVRPVRQFLKLADNYEDIKKDKLFQKFMRSFLTGDGAFLLKMISLNAGDIVCADVLQNLWNRFMIKVNNDLPIEDCPRHEGLMNLPSDSLEPYSSQKKVKNVLCDAHEDFDKQCHADESDSFDFNAEFSDITITRRGQTYLKHSETV